MFRPTAAFEQEAIEKPVLDWFVSIEPQFGKKFKLFNSSPEHSTLPACNHVVVLTVMSEGRKSDS